MDRLTSMQVFVRVVDAGSFARVAHALTMSRAMVTTHVASLEKHLGARLLNRTTRKLSLTDDGAAFYERCRRVLSEVQEMESAISLSQTKPQGRLRITMPTVLGRVDVIPALPAFLARYPDLQVEISLNDRFVDLVEEGMDVALRVGHLGDSTLVAKRIATSRVVTCAAPDYLKQFGVPQTPQDLVKHNCVLLSPGIGGRLLREWDFAHDGRSVTVEVSGNLVVNDVGALIFAGVSGLGVVRVPNLGSLPAIAAGLLQPLLADWTVPDGAPMSVVYPQNRHLSAKVRAFVDFVTELYQEGNPRPTPSTLNVVESMQAFAQDKHGGKSKKR